MSEEQYRVACAALEEASTEKADEEEGLEAIDEDNSSDIEEPIPDAEEEDSF